MVWFKEIGSFSGTAAELFAALRQRYGVLCPRNVLTRKIRNCSRDPIKSGAFIWRFKLVLKKNGLPEKLSVYSLRHSDAILLIANGADVAAAAGFLGRSQPSTTMDIYIQAFEKNKKAASKALQRGLDI